MSIVNRSVLVTMVSTACAVGAAHAQQAPEPQQQQQPQQQSQPQPQPQQPMPGQPYGGMPAMTTIDPNVAPPMAMSATATPTPEDTKKKEPGRGDFDAGGQVRLPSGPDESGKFATFNWIAVDLKGRYFLLDSVTVNANIPVALKHPDAIGDGTGAMISPSMIGGALIKLDARLPKLPGMRASTDVGVTAAFGYMREGAMLLSEKDYPLFVGDFKPGVQLGPIAKVKLSTLVDFSLTPLWVHQSGTMSSHSAVQIPMSLLLKVGSLVQASADLGVFTGDDYSFSGDKGGRIAAGGSLTVKIGPILAHAGAGVASLQTGGLYPTISDSIYIDVNAKYVK